MLILSAALVSTAIYALGIVLGYTLHQQQVRDREIAFGVRLADARSMMFQQMGDLSPAMVAAGVNAVLEELHELTGPFEPGVLALAAAAAITDEAQRAGAAALAEL